MQLPVVVGVDGSECSLRAVDWATDEAARHGLPLRLVHASLWQRYESPEAPGPSAPDAPGPSSPAASGAADVLGRAVERATRRNPDVRLLTDVVCEETERALLREARNATALVVGERGCGAVPGLLLGTVALAMAVRAPCPVVVVRGGAPNRGGAHGRVLLAAGEAASGAGAVRFAFREAALRHSELLALRAWRCPASQTAGRLRWPEDRVKRHEQRAAHLLDDALRPIERAFPRTEVVRVLVEGPAHEVLLAHARRADLLVTGARRRHHHLGAQIGRVAHTMLHHADCPVAVVPHRG